MIVSRLAHIGKIEPCEASAAGPQHQGNGDLASQGRGALLAGLTTPKRHCHAPPAGSPYRATTKAIAAGLAQLTHDSCRHHFPLSPLPGLSQPNVLRTHPSDGSQPPDHRPSPPPPRHHSEKNTLETNHDNRPLCPRHVGWTLRPSTLPPDQLGDCQILAILNVMTCLCAAQEIT